MTDQSEAPTAERDAIPGPDEQWDQVVDAQGVTWRRSGRGCWFAIRSDEECRPWAELTKRAPLEVLR